MFWVICLLVIICLHLGSISSLFLFCFRHWRTFLASASVQNLYTERDKTGNRYRVTESETGREDVSKYRNKFQKTKKTKKKY